MIHEGEMEQTSSTYCDGRIENGSRWKHEAPPLRFAPVGMTELFRGGEVVRKVL
jgi:hypothetical protein